MDKRPPGKIKKNAEGSANENKELVILRIKN
jgi:hypothetical protein